MSVAFLILSAIVAAGAGAAGAGEADGQEETVYRESFDPSADADFDGFPDGWKRRAGRGYPHYLKIGIALEKSAPGDGGERFLRIELNGGGAGLDSPPLPIDPQFAYAIDGQVKTERLLHDRAWLSIQFLDRAEKPIGPPVVSTRVSGEKGWRTLSIGPISSTPPEARWAVIGLHVEPTDRADLSGSASFDALRVWRLPRMTLEASRPHLVFDAGEPIVITCRASGISDPRPRFQAELYDGMGVLVAHSELPLAAGGEPSTAAGPAAAHTAIAEWTPPAAAPGLYRAKVTMRTASGAARETLFREIQFARLSEASGETTGEFGWSVHERLSAERLTSLAGLMTQTGVGVVKLPVWYSPDDFQSLDRAAWFAERLTSRGGKLIGVLDRPPAAARSQFGGEGPLPVATVFVEPKAWRPLVDPVMTRLSLKIESWQLGADDDASFVDYPALEKKIAEIKTNLELYGQEVHLGFVWPWMREEPAKVSQSSLPPWRFLCLTADPPLTAAELDSYLEVESAQDQFPVAKWLELSPLPRGSYSYESRARDLVERMLIARKHKLAAVCVPDPFDENSGFFERDGSPGELFLPWRTTAGLIAGAEHMGSLALPNGSQNMLFARGDEAVLAVWSDAPVSEKLYLGENTRQIDLSGRGVMPAISEGEQVFSVGPLPSFITGVHLPIARWRMSFALDQAQLASVFGRPQTASLRFRNYFPQGAYGTVTIHAPDVWEVSPRQIPFELTAGEEAQERFQVVLGAGAASGKQSIRADIEVTADRTYRFSVFREVEIGLGDVYIELATSLDERGDLLVRQDFVNETDAPINFNCLLFAPDRRRIRKQVIRQSRGRQTTVYRLANGADLVGKTLALRAEEIGGDRVLNYRVVAER